MLMIKVGCDEQCINGGTWSKRSETSIKYQVSYSQQEINYTYTGGVYR